MKPASFHYHRPDSIEDVLSLLAMHGEEAALIAGGQSLVPMMNMRLARPAHLIDINHLAGLEGARFEGDWLEIGANTRHQDLSLDFQVRKHCPILAYAAGTIGHYAIRQRGTLGGSLAMADPSAQLPVIAALFDAEILLRSMRGERSIPASEYFVAAMTTEKREDEMIITVRFPILGEGESWGFELFAPRTGDYAIVLAAAVLRRDPQGAISSLKLALGGATSAPVLFSDIFAPHIGNLPDNEWPATIAEEIASRVEPERSGQYGEDYKRELICALVERALVTAVESKPR